MPSNHCMMLATFSRRYQAFKHAGSEVHILLANISALSSHVRCIVVPSHYMQISCRETHNTHNPIPVLQRRSDPHVWQRVWAPSIRSPEGPGLKLEMKLQECATASHATASISSHPLVADFGAPGNHCCNPRPEICEMLDSP